jgi:hypothetical protein
VDDPVVLGDPVDHAAHPLPVLRDRLVGRVDDALLERGARPLLAAVEVLAAGERVW